MTSKILPLPESIRSYLRSGITVTSSAQCVEELVLNSIDAGATSVAVRVDLEIFKLQVVDNGHGISRENLDLIGVRHATSKCNSIEDLRENICHYGFRGEGIASIIDVSGIVDISTRPATSDYSYSLLFSYGRPKAVRTDETKRSSVGTTVTIQDFLYNMPVRRKVIKESVDIESIRNKIESIALIHSGISFSLRNDRTGSKIIQIHKSKSMLPRFASLYGNDIAEGLVEVYHSLDQFEFSGYISIQPHVTKALQFLYVNKRLVLKTKMHKFLNYLLSRTSIINTRFHPASSMNCKGPGKVSSSPPKCLPLYGIFVINIECPRKEYDVCLDPAKTLVEFKLWDKVLRGIEELILKFAEEEDIVISLDERFQKSEPNEAKLKNLPTDELPIENTWDVFRVDRGGKQSDINEKYGKTVCTRSLHASVHSNPVKRLKSSQPTYKGNFENDINSECCDDETSMNDNEKNGRENEDNIMKEKTSLSKEIMKKAESSLDELRLCTERETFLTAEKPDEAVKDRSSIKAGVEDIGETSISIMNDYKHRNPLPNLAEELFIPAVEENTSSVGKETSSSLSEFKKFYREEMDHISNTCSETLLCDSAVSQKSLPLRVNETAKCRAEASFHRRNVRVNASGKSISCALGQSFKKHKKSKGVLKALQRFEPAKLGDSRITEFRTVAIAENPEKMKLESSPFTEEVKCYSSKDDSPSIVNRITNQNQSDEHAVKKLNINTCGQGNSESTNLFHDHRLACSNNLVVVRGVKSSCNDYKCNAGDRQYGLNDDTKFQNDLPHVNVGYQLKRVDIGKVQPSSCSRSVEQSGIRKGISKDDDERESFSLLDSQISEKRKDALHSSHDFTKTRIPGDLVIPKIRINLSGKMFSIFGIKQRPVFKKRDQPYSNKSRLLMDKSSSSVINYMQIYESKRKLILKPLDLKVLEAFRELYQNVSTSHCLLHLHRFFSQGINKRKTGRNIMESCFPSSKGFSLKEICHNMNVISNSFDLNSYKSCAEIITKNSNRFADSKAKFISADYMQLCLETGKPVDEATHEKISFVYTRDSSSNNSWSPDCESLHRSQMGMLSQHDTLENSRPAGENLCDVSYIAKNLSEVNNLQLTKNERVQESLLETAGNETEMKEVNQDDTEMFKHSGYSSFQGESCKPSVGQNVDVLNSSTKEWKCLKSRNHEAILSQSWHEAKDSTGHSVYINSCTGNSTFQPPYHIESSTPNSSQPIGVPLVEIPVSSKLWGSRKGQKHFALSHSFSYSLPSKGDRDSSSTDTTEKMCFNSISEQNQLQTDITPSIQETIRLHNKDISKDNSFGLFFEEDYEDDAIKWKDKQCYNTVHEKPSQIAQLCQTWENPNFEMEPGISNIEAKILENEEGGSVQVYNLVHPYRFTKEMLSSFEIIGQLDKKFIVCRLNYDDERAESVEEGRSVIIVFDQHAVHERIRLEQITKENQTTLPSGRRVILSAISSPAMELTLQKDEVQIMSSFCKVFQDIGIHFEEKSPNKILVTAIPNCLVAREASELRHRRCQTVTAIVESVVKEVCHSLLQTKGTAPVIPRVLSSVLNSQACRGAIKFGDPLNKEECKELVSALKHCQMPFQCAHGRPAIVPLVELTYLSSISKKVKKPNMKRISEGLKKNKLECSLTC